MFISKILGTQDLPEQAQHYMRLFVLLTMIISFLTSLSSTFYILFTIDQIGFALAAVCTSVMLSTQLIFDYPSGSLGDWIGQRWVLALAYVSYGLAFLYLTAAYTFVDFIIVSIINGFGNAQASGAMETWVDNNYRVAVGELDSERKTYGFSRSRVYSLNNLAFAASFLIGGFLASSISRRFVFSIQFGLTIVVILLILTFLRDIKVDTESSHESNKLAKSNNNYFDFLRGGISFLFSSKGVFLFLIGTAIYNVTWMIWGSLILFPLYYGYTGSDVFASLLRTVLFISGIPISFYMANITKKISNNTLPLVLFLQVILFFPSFFLLLYFLPPRNSFNLVGIIATFFLLWILVGSLFEIGTTLQQRIMIDFVPSENRNAVYSLMPTIFSLVGIPLLPVAGTIIENYGLAYGIIAAGIVCFAGSIIIYYGLRFRRKSANQIKTNTSDASIIPSGDF